MSINMKLNPKEADLIKQYREEQFRKEQEKLLLKTIKILVGKFQEFTNETGDLLSFSTFIDSFLYRWGAENLVPNELEIEIKQLYELVEAAHQLIGNLVKERSS